MIIELQRAFDPKSMGEENCGVCGQSFRAESVLVLALTDNREEVGWACPSCVECLGRRNPERFPSLEEYEAARRRYPEPIYASVEESERKDPWLTRDPTIERSEFAADHDIWCSLAHRGDSLNDAFAVIEDTPEDRLRNDSRQRIYAILAKERDIAWAAAKRYAENFKRQEEAGVVDGG